MASLPLLNDATNTVTYEKSKAHRTNNAEHIYAKKVSNHREIHLFKYNLVISSLNKESCYIDVITAARKES